MQDTLVIDWSNGIPANGEAELLNALTARHAEHQAALPRYRMLETRTGSPDGFDVISYEAGETYDLPHNLACRFIHNKWAVCVEPAKTLDEVTAEIIAEMQRAA